MKIIHEREKCIGCGACVGVCPNNWEMEDDGKSRLISSKPNLIGNFELEVQEAGCSQDAVESCPVSIIHIEK